MSIQLYDKTKIDWEHRIFSNKDLRVLIVPLMIEQFLNCFMGMADTMMVSRAGEAAISAVSLVDSINVLITQIFTALATGGTIICAQYLGRNEKKECNQAARQVVFTVAAISVVIAVACILWRRPLLAVIFGNVDADVMQNSITYMWITALSFPFIALFQAGAAFYQAGGNSRLPMMVSVISNLMNIGGNAILIFGLQMGVAGAAYATLVSRIFCMAVIFWKLRKPGQTIVIRQVHKIRPDLALIKKILAIGVPSGVENGMFQFGKLAIQSSVSTLGTAAIAAQAVTNMLESTNGIAAIAIGIGMMTIVGQCIGAGRKEEAKYYIVKLSILAELVIVISCVLVFAVTKPVIFFAALAPDSARMCWEMMCAITIVKPLVWVFAFVPPYGMRAAGDVRFSMIMSMIVMWGCRVALATVLIRVCGMGPMAVWIGMFADWTIRGLLYSLRFLSGKWLQHKVI